MMLPVQWQGQPDETWCWATSASIISVYYAQMGAGQAFSACEVAGRTLGTLCCAPVPTDPPPPECQTSFDLERALDAVGHLNPNADRKSVGQGKRVALGCRRALPPPG